MKFTSQLFTFTFNKVSVNFQRSTKTFKSTSPSLSLQTGSAGILKNTFLSNFFFKIWQRTTVYFCSRGATPCIKPAACKGLKGKKCDRGTPSHLVVDHNQCLAWTVFGHWSLQHHAGPTVPLSKHCPWQGLCTTECDWRKMKCGFKAVDLISRF